MQADARTPNSEPLKWALSADSEALTWAPHEPTTFVVRLALYKLTECLTMHHAISSCVTLHLLITKLKLHL